jgi:hypothetical protein
MRLAVAALAVLLAGASQTLRAEASATPSPSPAPAATPAPSASPAQTPFVTPAPPAPAPAALERVTWNTAFYTNFASSAVGGPGVLPPEATGFINGSPVAPGTPYDFFSSAVTTNGNGASVQMLGSAEYASSHGWRVDASYGFGALQGGANTIGYWNEPIFPTLDPHFSGYRLALPVAFPTHAGQDDTAGIAAAITGVHVNVDRGGWTLNAGYIQPAQTLRFVFAPPPNAVAALGVTPSLAETLTGGPPSLNDWSQLDPAIPMEGIEMVKTFGATTTLAVDDAALASLPGTQTRVTSASLQIDRGGGNQFGLQVVHANLAGDSILGGVLFGANPQLSTGPQGNLPTSTLASQRQTIVGLRQALHHGRDYGVVEIGRSWYDATPVSTPSTDSGGYYHLGFAHDFGIGTVQIDAYRFEPRYAQMVLPYGTPENIWSVAWSWPGVWLKSTYQLVDNTQVGINRQGLRLKWSGTSGTLQYGLSVSHFRQVEPETVANALVEGFVDGYFLPEFREATIGEQSQAAGYVTWHLPFCDLTADGVDDAFHRTGSVARDAVSYDVPQYVLSASKTMQSTVIAVGMGRYGMLGSWASGSQNVNLAQRQLFAGVETKLPWKHELLVSYRRILTAGLSGTPPIPANTNGNLLLVEDRFAF